MGGGAGAEGGPLSFKGNDPPACGGGNRGTGQEILKNGNKGMAGTRGKREDGRRFCGAVRNGFGCF